MVEWMATAAQLADRLCAEALWDGGRATWFGDQMANLDGRWEVVHRDVGGDLYGGTAGIGLALSRLFAATGDDRHRRTSLGALTHAAAWLERTRPPPSLYGGSLGVITAMAEAARGLDTPAFAEDASRRAQEAAEAPRLDSFDLIGGTAGAIIAWLRLADLLDEDRYLSVACALADELCTTADRQPAWASWSDPHSTGCPPLCGLGHGASGAAVALAELGVRVGDRSYLQLARAAFAYERAWYDREALGWPELRELDRAAVSRGDRPPTPDFWCHGSLGIGLARCRLHELTGDAIDGVEAGAALQAAELRLEREEVVGTSDASLCHGTAGVVELFAAAANVFQQSSLAVKAQRAADVMVSACDVATGTWPCGVRDGGENPSLMLGLAGIAAVLQRVAQPEAAPVGLPYTCPIETQRLIVKLAGDVAPADAVAKLDELLRQLPDARVERVSKTGRALVRLAPAADANAALALAKRLDGIEYAELDVTDHAVDH
jgi:lantibiotic modifying enzyme